MASIYRYLDLYSLNRDRTLYPNPTDFACNVSYTNNPITSVFNAKDPVSLGIPYVIDNTGAGSTTTDIVLSSLSSPIDNYYSNELIQIGGVYTTITSYSGTTKTATVSPAFAVAPLAGTGYSIQSVPPILSSTLGINNTQNEVDLGISASSDDGKYTGMFIYFFTGANQGISEYIRIYNGITKIAKLSKALPNIPAAGDRYIITNYSYDNDSPLLYYSTTGFGQAICYSIELLYLTIPNQTLNSGYGGSLNNYPFLYVYLFNEGNKHSEFNLYTNNPNNQGALFKVPLGLNLRTETFFTLKDAKMIQMCKFKLDQPVHIKILLPDGSPIIFKDPENYSPLEPNPLIQISATFALRRIDK